MKQSDINWLLDYFRDNNNPDESHARELFCDESRKEDLRKLLSEQFDSMMKEKQSTGLNLDHILYRIHYNINSSQEQSKVRRSAIIFRWSARIAAGILLPLLIFWAAKGFVNYKEFDTAVAEIHAPAWTRTSFVLPDGSTGWLNSNSTLKYRVNFKKERHVELNGEAYFDVESDRKKPFTVDAGEIEVKVHGTKFNVASWKNEENIEVVLGEGVVELTAKDSDSSFMLKPDELAVYDRTGRNFTRAAVESNKYLSWTEGKLVFRNDPLEVVGRRLERWYNVDVVISGAYGDDFRLRATFVDESLEEVLEMLSRSVNIGYSIEKQGMNSDNTYGKRKVNIYIKNKNNAYVK